MTALDARASVDGVAGNLARAFVAWLETGMRQDGMLTTDVFADLTLPHWRLQAHGEDAVYHLREDEHPFSGEVHVEALDLTSRGFLLQFEERWHADGQRWYCRELIHCTVAGSQISELAIYCTGDWDEAVQQRHAAQVRLLRP